MERDVFVCANRINYIITISVLASCDVSRPLILLDKRRCLQDKRVVAQHWDISKGIARRIFSFLAKVGIIKIRNYYIPHHRLHFRLDGLRALATEVRYIDDGLDTRRYIPKNFDLSQLVVGSKYFTFEDYEKFPTWMNSLAIVRVALLDICANSLDYIFKDFERFKYIFVESPGCDVDKVVEKMNINMREVLVIRHPSAVKRKLLFRQYRLFDGNKMNTDAIIKNIVGKKIFFGETISFYIAIAAGVSMRNSVFFCLGGADMNSLVGLPNMRVESTSNDISIYRVSD